MVRKPKLTEWHLFLIMMSNAAKNRFHRALAVVFVSTLTGISTHAPSVSAQDAKAQARTPLPKIQRTHFITQRRPKRKPGTLRYENLSDIEMRQIMRIARKENPGAVLNVSGVIVGCPCEDGAHCTDQVWIVAHKQNRTRGLMLSNIDAQWTIGPVQKWWLRRDRLDAEHANARSENREALVENWSKYSEALNRLITEFPKCEAQTPPQE